MNSSGASTTCQNSPFKKTCQNSASSYCMFGSTFGGEKIDSRGIELILTC